MFCHMCGEEISGYSVCGSDVLAPVKFDKFNQKTGEKWFEFSESLEYNAKNYICRKWGHKLKHLTWVTNIKYKRDKYSFAIIYRVPEKYVTHDVVIIGQCPVSCCPLCGAENPKGGGCFVATAVYGSPSSPEVIALRQFRDEVLLQSRVGKILVAVYYRVSPSLAHVISKSRAMKKMMRNFILAPIVKVLTKSSSKV